MNVQTLRLTLCLTAVTILPAFAASAEISLADNNRTMTHTCTAGESISIAGNNNTLHLSGPCGALNVSGNGNHITTTQLTDINTVGNSNVVTWSKGSPHISNVGTGNRLTGQGSAASTGIHGRVQGGSNIVSDGAGNTVQRNADGSTLVKDAAGNTVSTRPH